MLTDEIQAEPPRPSRRPDLGEFPDVSVRKPRPWVRLWVIGIVCFFSGLTSHIVLQQYAPIVQGRAQMAGYACFEGLWYGLGLLLLLVDASLEKNPGMRTSKFLGVGLGAVVAFVLVVISLPP
jgi:hypothetical protein